MSGSLLVNKVEARSNSASASFFAWDAGRSWVGPNARQILDKSGDLIGFASENGMRAFRVGFKPTWGQYQANFQQNMVNERTGQVIQLFNAHLNIINK